MRQEVYRVAFDEARAELNEILSKFEQLRLRKDRIEKVVEALKPLLSGNDIQISSASAERAAGGDQSVYVGTPEPVQAAASPIPYPLKQAIEPSNDPFSRRTDSAPVGVGTGASDVKEYSRLFNTAATRGN